MGGRRAHVQPDTQSASILERQREANTAKDNDAFHHADEAFHATIAEVAKYPGIWRLIQQVKIHVDRYRRLTLRRAEEWRSDRGARSHPDRD